MAYIQIFMLAITLAALTFNVYDNGDESLTPFYRENMFFTLTSKLRLKVCFPIKSFGV